ncbi:MAG: YbaB/EbfC family nucleoid-associated protein [Patescibacteria group bacterium]|nr:YbaB/EbfC family nucleoid-associated protein [Patescibacteria group bacterium]
MGLFNQAKDMYSMRAKAKKFQQTLADELIEVEADNGNIIITISADQKVQKIVIQPAAMKSNTELGELLKKAFNKAIEIAQKIAAEKMKAMGGFPGLGM